MRSERVIGRCKIFSPVSHCAPHIPQRHVRWSGFCTSVLLHFGQFLSSRMTGAEMPAPTGACGLLRGDGATVGRITGGIGFGSVGEIGPGSKGAVGVLWVEPEFGAFIPF